MPSESPKTWEQIVAESQWANKPKQPKEKKKRGRPSLRPASSRKPA